MSEPTISTLCGCKTKDGKPCSRALKPGATRCWQHAKGWKQHWKAIAPWGQRLIQVVSLVGSVISILVFVLPGDHVTINFPPVRLDNPAVPPTTSEGPKAGAVPSKNSHEPPPKKLHINFKNSLLFTPQRRNQITVRMESFYDYLGQLGLTAPKDVPPIGAGQNYGGAFIYPGPIYMDTVRIPEKSVDDPMAPARAYAGYCFPFMLEAFDVNEADVDRRTRASWIFQAYFVSSFFGERPSGGSSQIDNWVGALWDIRQQYGKEFADTATAFGLKAFNDFGKGGNSKLDLDTYFPTFATVFWLENPLLTTT